MIDLNASIHDLVLSLLKIKFSPQVKILWKAGIFSLLWAVWSTRNQMIFEDKKISTSSSMAFIISSIREVNKVSSATMSNSQSDLLVLKNLGVSLHPNPSPNIIPVRWLPPPPDWIKVNTDGAARGAPGPSGCGGIFRNYRGFVKGSFAFSVGNCFAFEAELLAFIFAIEKAAEFNWSKLWIEVYSIYVLWAYRKMSVSIPWKIRQRWLNALCLANNLNVVVSHIYREGNSAADKLASSAATASLDGWWFYAPPLITGLIARDMSGLPYYRFS